MKKCTKCGILKDLSLFHKRPETKDGRRTDCKECCKKKKQELWASLPLEEKQKRNTKLRLKYHYDLTVEEYNEKVKEQHNKCYICGVEGGYNKKPLYVDHCHQTNKIRKLLCQHCNSGLGMFKDNPELLKKAVNYIEEHNVY